MQNELKQTRRYCSEKQILFYQKPLRKINSGKFAAAKENSRGGKFESHSNQLEQS